MNTKRFALTILIITFALTSVGCANFNKASYRAMGTMQMTYDIGMKSIADLQAKGLITPEGRELVNTEARNYANAHNAAVDDFIEYLQAETAAEQEQKKLQYITASKVVLKFYSALLNIFTRHGVYGEPVEPWF